MEMRERERYIDDFKICNNDDDDNNHLNIFGNII